MDEQEFKRRQRIAKVEGFGIVPYMREPLAVAVQDIAKNTATAFVRLDRYLDMGSSGLDAFGAFHEAINHAGNLSKFFFPAREKIGFAKSRGEFLRECFAVGPLSPLSNRDLRNTLEHFDERLDDFFLGLDDGILIVTPIIENAEIADDPAGVVFKAIDPQKKVAVVLGKKFAYGDLLDEVVRIANLRFRT